MPARHITKRQLGAALVAAVLLLSPVAPVHAQSASPTDPHRMTDRTVSVSAQGRVSAAPDRASIATGIQVEAATAREAMAANSAAMNKLIDGLKALGVQPKDIQTTAINVNPRYTNATPNRPPVINGYTALNQVRVVVTDLKRLGEILDAALTLGANQMGGISVDVSTAETLKDEARKAAMVNARRRAELYAAAAGATLGPVIAIAEDVRTASPGPMPRARAMAASMEAPVEAGSIDLDATVHVTWALK